MIGASRRFVAEGDKSRGEVGAPAMHRWLRDQRFLDWLAPDLPPPRVMTAEEKAAEDAAWATYLSTDWSENGKSRIGFGL